MQQMQEPEKRSYGEGYQIDPDPPLYRPEQSYQAYAEPAERLQQPYQQKIQPLSKVNLGLAQASVSLASFAMGLAITVFVLTTIAFSKVVGASEDVAELPTVAFVFSLLLLLLTVAGFVVAIVQLVLIEKKFPKRRNRYERMDD